MAKFYGNIGFVETVETSKDVWDTVETPRPYCGDLVRNQRRWENGSESVNENLTISNEVSIIADKFAMENLNAMKWVEFGGAKWRINSVTINYPRIVLTIGEVYNGG
jgi:hypothetical protein